MKRRVWLIVFYLFILCCSLPTAALAHSVGIFAYIQGNTVYSESYFVNGDPVVLGLVTVADARGRELRRGKTDADGNFNFPLPTKPGDLHLTLDASMGHKASFVLKMDGDGE
jgi:nickel transport protein